MKEQEKNTPRELNEIQIGNMFDGEFEVMVIKIFTGLKKSGGSQ